jgi:hypothetical protein
MGFTFMSKKHMFVLLLKLYYYKKRIKFSFNYN